MNSNCQSLAEKSVSQPMCIVGLGLIGGSLLRRLTAAGYPAFGWNRSASTVQQAAADGMDVSGDLSATLQRAARENALIVMAVPLFALRDIVSQIAAHAPQCPLTDVVSVKVEVLRIVQEAGLAATYVGSHPMAGTENSGWGATDPALFENATWVVMTGGADDVTARVRDIAVAAGSVVVETDPVSHDGAVACISHVPHLVAEALSVAAVTESVGAGIRRCGYRRGRSEMGRGWRAPRRPWCVLCVRGIGTRFCPCWRKLLAFCSRVTGSCPRRGHAKRWWRQGMPRTSVIARL